MKKIMEKLPDAMLQAIEQLTEKYRIRVRHGQVSFDLYEVRVYLENLAVKEVMDNIGIKYQAFHEILTTIVKLKSKIEKPEEESTNLIVNAIAKMFYLMVDQELTDFKSLMIAMSNELIELTSSETEEPHSIHTWIFDVCKICDFAYFLGNVLLAEFLSTIEEVEKTGNEQLLIDLDKRDILPYKLGVAHSLEEAKEMIQKEQENLRKVVGVDDLGSKIQRNLASMKTIGEA